MDLQEALQSNKSTAKILDDNNLEKKILDFFSKFIFLDDEIASIIIKDFFHCEKSNLISSFKLKGFITYIDNNFWCINDNTQQNFIHKDNIIYDYRKLFEIIENYIKNISGISKNIFFKYLLILDRIELFISESESSNLPRLSKLLCKHESKHVLKIADLQLSYFVGDKNNINTIVQEEAIFVKAKLLYKTSNKKSKLKDLYELFNSIINGKHFNKEIVGEAYQLVGYLQFKYDEHKLLKVAIENLKNSIKYLSDNFYLLSKSYDILGNIYRTLGKQGNDENTDNALKCYDLAIEASEKSNNKLSMSYGYKNKGIVYYKIKKDFNKAKENFDKSLELSKSIGELEGQSKILHDIGLVYMKLKNDYEKAKAYYEESLQLKRQINDKSGQAQVLLDLGMLHYRYIEDCTNAEKYFNQSIAIDRELGNDDGIAKVYHELANMYSYKLNDIPKALQYLKESYELDKSKYHVKLVYGTLAKMSKKNKSNKDIDILQKEIKEWLDKQ